MAPHDIPKQEGRLTVAHPDDVAARKIAKAAQALRIEEKLAVYEMAANEIFGKAFETWLPGGRKLYLSYQRQRVSAESNAALTARYGTTSFLPRPSAHRVNS
jgi:hypothetical protein